MTDEPAIKDNVVSWLDFLKVKCKKQLAELGREYPFKRSLFINLQDVENWGETGIKLAAEAIELPEKCKEDIYDAVISNNLIKTADNKPAKLLVIRFIGIGKKTNLRDLRVDHIDQLVSVDAQCNRYTEVRPRIDNAVFKCGAGHFTDKKQKYGHFIEPSRCGTDGCELRKLDLITKRSTFINQQRIQIQENGDGLRSGQQPQRIDVVITGDICDSIFPGERATFNGIVRSMQKIVRGEKSTVFDLYLELQSVEIKERDYEEVVIDEESIERITEIAKSGMALDMISGSIAPTIYGYPEIKRGAALLMFGGVSSINADGTGNRGDIHILIIGDPGTAKTKLIKYIARQSPRGVFVTAVTSSGGGLTGIATRDDEGRWTIEPGALPLADMGIAAVDEIDKADSDLINNLLSIMEDGEIPITTAGQNRLLKARDSLICAGNWKNERYDSYAQGGIADQISLPAAFLSRFDLIFTMIDNPEQKQDEAKSRHLIKTRYIAECRAAGKLDRITDEDRKEVEPPIPTHLLKQYIAYAKRSIMPIMNPQVREYLTKHYVDLRGKPVKDSPSPVTMRQQEALVRLAEASARIRLSQEVTLKDAETAISIFDNCMKAVATDPKTGQLDFGRIGMGIAKTKQDLLKAIKSVIIDEPGLSQSLLLSKMDEKGFKSPEEIKEALETLKKKAEIIEPKNEHYRVI